jgi:Flp pilus assembly pilin Flp
MWARGSTKRRHTRWRALAGDDRGAEQMEYVLILAAVVLPMIVAVRLMWGVLLYYFTVESFVIDLPLF